MKMVKILSTGSPDSLEVEINEFMMRIYENNWGFIDIKFSSSHCYDPDYHGVEIQLCTMIIYEVTK